MKGTKTVWVLGSGFSKSLGGPLLYELISDKTKEETHQVFPELGDREVVYGLYKKHLNVLWRHAEDFLDYIDTALMPGSPRQQILERHINTAAFEALGGDPKHITVDELRREAILTVAAECSTYTDSVDVRSEAWAPYVDWACKLGDSDTIVTFNYDLALERIGASRHVRVGAIGEATVAFPTGGSDGHVHLLSGNSVCPIFKMHGSVDWAFKPGAPTKRLGSLKEVMLPGGYQLLIATPGATKTKYVNDMLQVIWANAMAAISDAEVIVFIGYRFPPSDSEARTRLLRAIEENKSAFLKIHTVLGPNVNEADVLRLKGLLTHKLRAAGRVHVEEFERLNPRGGRLPLMYEVVAQPLLAEDFMTVVHPSNLFEDYIANAINQSRPIRR